MSCTSKTVLNSYTIDNVQRIIFTTIYLKEFVLAVVVALPSQYRKISNIIIMARSFLLNVVVTSYVFDYLNLIPLLSVIWKIYLLTYLFIYLFIYKIRHQQNKDKIDNIKNTKAGAVDREELQLWDPNINRTQHNTHYNSTTHI